MTDREILERAKMYIDKMAMGINPLDDNPVNENDLINNVRISRCLFYVSGILADVLQNGGKVASHKNSRAKFTITYEELRNMKFSDTPIGISELTQRINDCKSDDGMKKLSYTTITNWLCDNGFLVVVNKADGKNAKRPSAAGQEIGILTEDRTGPHGEYTAVLYSLQAQHFVVDNLETMLGVY